MLKRIQLILLVLTAFSYPSLCVDYDCENERLIPACDLLGGVGEIIQNNTPLQADIFGNYEYANHKLMNMTIYHNGTVDFNGGSMSIAVFGANLTGGVTANFVYQNSSALAEVHFEAQKDYVAGVLDAADNNVTDMFVITWTNYTYNGINIDFQLAIASTTSNATYALLLYDGEGTPTTPNHTVVTTGFRIDEVCGYQHQTLVSEDVESLWNLSNIGTPGVFLYEISTISYIRLVDNKTDVNGIYGTVEVYYNGEWRLVCDDYWTDVEADVACGELGYLPYGAEALHFKGTTKDYWLDDVNCRGSESSIFDCTYKMIGNCRQGKRAAVRCKKCGEHIDIRHNSTSGIIELKYNNEWRPVCANFWSQEDARVACKELGLPYFGAMAMSEDEKETGERSKFWMDYVHCKGDEESLFACRHMGVGTIHGRTCRKRAAVHCI